ncbi:flavin reductase family protein [Alkalihalobacillus sp. NPDC078783]
MHTLLSKELTAKDHYKLLSGSVVPRPIAFVTTLSSENQQVVNAAPFSFFTIVSSNPPILAISVSRKEGEMKDTARNVLKHKELVIHLTDEENLNDINATAASLSPLESELTLTKFHVKPSEIVEVPGILEAKIRYECTLHEHIPIRDDQGVVSNDLILARVVCYHVSEEVYEPRTGYIQTDKLRPVARLAGHEYAQIQTPFELKRPT